jgi:hypothetical protein
MWPNINASLAPFFSDNACFSLSGENFGSLTNRGILTDGTYKYQDADRMVESEVAPPIVRHHQRL